MSVTEGEFGRLEERVAGTVEDIRDLKASGSETRRLMRELLGQLELELKNEIAEKAKKAEDDSNAVKAEVISMKRSLLRTAIAACGAILVGVVTIVTALILKWFFGIG